ncbi:hypothetical protein VCSRO66_2877 [Vibrio cholerae]|nr:hypothetical protein VCSRO66_2877 [Vibrio cholerae]
MVEISQKNLEAKKNHHHVWANYMKRWSPNGRDIYYTTKSKKIKFDSIRSVCVEQHLYQVKPLTKEHVDVILAISAHSPKDLQELHISQLNYYLNVQKMVLMYDKSKVQDDLADKIIYAWKCNGLENFHTAHENEAKPILEALANEDLNILKDSKNMILFTQFLAHQDTRTKNFRDTIIASFSRADSQTEKHISRAMIECWWFLSYMIGMNIGRSIYLDRNNDTHSLLINNTNTPFITSDQPIINVHQALQYEGKPPQDHECDLYFPISPNVAYMINKSNRFPHGKVQVSIDVVNEMNMKIAKMTNVHIVSNNEESLKPYQRYIGKNLSAVKAL